jgi:hypothetical protein
MSISLHRLSLAFKASCFIVFFSITDTQAQHGEVADSTNYHEFYRYYLYGDFYCASGFYQLATRDFPCNRQLNVDGKRMYFGMIEYVNRESLKELYIDTLMSLIDQLQTCFSEDSISILNMKLFALYRIYNQNPEKYIWLYSLFQNAFNKSPDVFTDNNIILYFDMARRCLISGKELNDDDIEDLYYELDELLERRIIANPSDISLVTIRDQLNTMIHIEPEINCEFVIANLLPKLDTKDKNMKLADSIVRLVLICNDCSDDDFSVIIKALEFYQYTKHVEMLESIRRSRNME